MGRIGLAEGPRMTPVERSARVEKRARSGPNMGRRKAAHPMSSRIACMQHVGKDGSREGEHEVGVILGDQVTTDRA